MKPDQIAMRDAYGEELLKLGEEYPGLTVLDADVSSSTRTAAFGKKFPDRFFNVGVAEANMVDIAGGLALCGLRPIVNSFAVFLTLKATEQIRNVICYNKLPVILVGSYAGLSDSYDGASHQSVEDIAVMRAMPNLNVIVPADAVELKQALRHALTLDGPTYIRTCRNPTPVVLGNAQPFSFGKISIIKEGSDVTIAATGIPVAMALQAAAKLEEIGIVAEILNISTIKPLDELTLVDSVKKTKCILTVEEHSSTGGLGSAVAEVLMKQFPVPADYIGINDTFTETGSYDELLDKYRISVDVIIEKVKKIVGQSS
ncbi:MAG: transketolase C-terminal domain-containing protein [Prolixibacteraceae bacterium]